VSPRGLTGLVVSIAATALVPFVSFDRFIFFPDQSGVPPPPLGVAERWFTTADGVRLHAWHAVAPDGAPTLVWSHGNAGNIAGRAPVLHALADRGLGVLAYDYRGYGKSGGRPSEAGVYRDVEAAYDSVALPGARIVAFGESLGGAVSIHLATVRPCAAVVVVSTFTTMNDVARFHYGLAGLLVGSGFDSLRRVRSVHVPLLVAHGDEDEVVPYALGEALFAAADEPKCFLRLPGAHHNDVFEQTALLDAIADFARAAAAAK
jgi:fermentation-respiration switch protein FrsA (DUF1100 family)